MQVCYFFTALTSQCCLRVQVLVLNMNCLGDQIITLQYQRQLSYRYTMILFVSKANVSAEVLSEDERQFDILYDYTLLRRHRQQYM